MDLHSRIASGIGGCITAQNAHDFFSTHARLGNRPVRASLNPNLVLYHARLVIAHETDALVKARNAKTLIVRN